jgi:hypothetical protein
MHKNTFYISLIFIVTFVVYYISLFNFLAIDDHRLLTHLLNDKVNFKKLFLENGGVYYRPLLSLSYYLDFKLWGLEISFYHLENLIIHFFNSILLFFLVKKLLIFYKYNGQNEFYISFLSVLIFIVNPLNTESVNWISGRSDLLSTFFVLIALNFLFHGLIKTNLYNFLLSYIFGFLGLLTKENAMSFFILYLFIILFRFKIKNIFIKVFLISVNLLCILVYFILRTNFFYKDNVVVSKISQAVDHYNYIKYVIVLFKAAGFYIKKLFVFYPLNFAIQNVSNIYIFLGLFFFVITLLLIFKKRLLTDMFIYSIIFFLPSLPIAAGNIAWTKYAERYLYASTLFFCIFIILLTKLFSEYFKPVIFKLPIIIIFVIYFCATLYRNYQWMDSVRLYKDTVEKSPHNLSIRNEYAIALMNDGKIQEANKVFSYLAKQNNTLGTLNYINIGMNKLNNIEDLLKYKQEILQLIDNKGKLQKHFLLTLIKINIKLMNLKENYNLIEENINYYDKLFIISNDPFFLYKKGQELIKIGKYEEAAIALEESYKKFPDNSIYKIPTRNLKIKVDKKIKKLAIP